MAEAGDAGEVWVLYEKLILVDLPTNEITLGCSPITMNPEPGITVELVQISRCSYQPISVRFEKSIWTFTSARAWWAAFEGKVQPCVLAVA